ncbi:site-specific integrase [Streptomyces sp. NPDC093108]|uniref:site-specific integrase n=1 Tax=Streptomyces sp. NPDC093108 TaxID=3366030 RepID=UPI003815BC5B
MDYFFVSGDKVRRFYEAPKGVDLEVRSYVERPGAVRDGTPFFLGPDMRPVEPLCSFFFELSKSLVAKTLADYTYDILDLLDFLGQLDPPLDLLSATEDDLVAYRDDRTQHQDVPISAGTWQRRRAAINNFYDWAVYDGLLPRRPYHRRRNGRDVLAWGSTTELDVRHLTFVQWRFLKQVGLRGLLPGDRADRSFRGAAPLRNSAAGELAVTTGMRLREFTSLLDIEVGPPRRDAAPVDVKLQAIAKYGLPRTVSIQDPTMRELDLYRRTERAAVVRAAARTLYTRREDWFVVDDINMRQMRLGGILRGRRRSFRIEQMPAPLRRITMIEGDGGLEPMALFVGRGGRMPSKSRWEQVFADAHERTLRISEEHQLGPVMPGQFRIHDTRHTFAVCMLQQLTQMVLAEEAERIRSGGHGGYLADHISRNPLLIVQRLLGHRQPSSSMRYLRYIRETNVLVTRALEEWNDRDTSYADYAALLMGGRAA